MKRTALQATAISALLLALTPATEVSAATSALSCAVGGPIAPLPGKNNGMTISHYQPGYFERLVGASKFTLEIKDRPDFLVGDREVTVNGETRTVPEFIPNPDQRLRKYSLEIAFVNSVVKPADLKTLYAAARAASGSLNLSVDPVTADRWAYFSRNRPRDTFGRLLSGFKLTVAVSERETPMPTEPVSPRLEQLLNEIDEHEETFAIEFDPTALFRTSSDYSSAAAALDTYAKLYKPGALGLGDVSPQGIRGAERFLIAALPKFKVQVVDQFDLFEFSGRFLRSALQEDSIEVYTLTWDLSRFIRSRSDELTDLGTVATLAKLAKTGLQVSAPRKTAIEEDKPVYWRLTATGGVTPVNWTLKASTCNGHDVDNGVVGIGLALESSGVVGGYPKGLPHRCSFKVEAADAIGQGTRLDCSLDP